MSSSNLMTAADIREAFLRFFESKGHTRVASSSLVPHDDPTLLFTNAGMNQFKDCFLGTDRRNYTRAASSQKCVRAGGKHNDLDNVGYTARHHTFFEMLGNFSFGDYFKQDAIRFAWEFLTSPEWLNLPKDRLYVTVYATDDEAFEIWNKEVGLAPERIIRIGDNKGAPYASDNFWAMGDTGPCGPCTEIFYDHGDHISGGLPGTPEEDGDRFIEIWNNVFMQFNRTADGQLHPLPAPSVDTGMGLERISAVMQHVNSNYDIDLFQHLLNKAAQITGNKNEGQPSLKVIADHARSTAFLIADGVVPGNEGRGYVLRRIIRRAIRHGHKMGAEGTFFYQMVQPLVDVMGQAYPELVREQKQIESVLQKEEEQFSRTLDQGMRLLEAELSELKSGVIPGAVVFKLYDTYGFPVDLTADIARERGLIIDEAGFEAEMEQQRQRARDAGKFGVDYNTQIKVDNPTAFEGYTHHQIDGKIIGLYRAGQPVDSLQRDEEGIIVLDRTPFYAESGGQAGDAGVLVGEQGIFDVLDTKKSGAAIVHHGVVKDGQLKLGQNVQASVKSDARAATARNHSATHLLHSALRKTLGTHVTQKGSLVSDDVLRFDFSHEGALTVEQLQEVEKLVNSEILANETVSTEVMSMEAALARGAMALFGEKYGDNVRVLAMGTKNEDKEFSIELCGGTHVKRTGDIGLFKILSESAIASGIRRIEAVTGHNALKTSQQSDQQLDQLARQMKVGRDQVAERVQTLLDKNKEQERQIEKLNQKLAQLQALELINNVQDINGVPTLIAALPNVDSKTLRTIMDSLKSKISNAVIVLAGEEGDKISLMAQVAKAHQDKIKAGDIVSHLASQLNGKGGGKAESAQGGGTRTDAYPKLVGELADWLTPQLA